MTHESFPARPPRRKALRVPHFYPVPQRGRQGGWTEARQAHFLGCLAETGSVSAAAERVGMSRNGAYRLRRKLGAESFAAAWDAALGAPIRKVTIKDLPYLAYKGLIRLRFFRGRYVGCHHQPDGSALLRLNARLERACRNRGW